MAKPIRSSAGRRRRPIGPSGSRARPVPSSGCSSARPLGAMMRDPKTPPATRVTAADKILDRALGRPAQQVDVTTCKDTLDYSLADLLAIAYGRGVGAATIDGEVVQ